MFHLVLVLPNEQKHAQSQQKKTEKNVKFFQGNNNVNDVVLVSLLLTLTYFTFSSSISVVDFEQVNILWVSSTLADT